MTLSTGLPEPKFRMDLIILRCVLLTHVGSLVRMMNLLIFGVRIQDMNEQITMSIAFHCFNRGR